MFSMYDTMSSADSGDTSNMTSSFLNYEQPSNSAPSFSIDDLIKVLVETRDKKVDAEKRVNSSLKKNVAPPLDLNEGNEFFLVGKRLFASGLVWQPQGNIHSRFYEAKSEISRLLTRTNCDDYKIFKVTLQEYTELENDSHLVKRHNYVNDATLDPYPSSTNYEKSKDSDSKQLQQPHESDDDDKNNEYTLKKKIDSDSLTVKRNMLNKYYDITCDEEKVEERECPPKGQLNENERDSYSRYILDKLTSKNVNEMKHDDNEITVNENIKKKEFTNSFDTDDEN